MYEKIKERWKEAQERMMAIIRLVYEAPNPENFDFYALARTPEIKAVLYSCGCCCVSKIRKNAALFPKTCPAHDNKIVGYWKNLSFTKKNLKRIKYVL